MLFLILNLTSTAAFYSPIFKNYQQKDISGLLTILWQSDPFKAKWSIMAKAYSLIRDRVGKEAAPLDLFLDLIYPCIGIVGPDEYLELLHWNLLVSDEGVKLVRDFASDRTNLDYRFAVSNMSVNDILVNLCHMDYIDAATLQAISSSAGNSSVNLAMAARPAQSVPSSVSGSSPVTPAAYSPMNIMPVTPAVPATLQQVQAGALLTQALAHVPTYALGLPVGAVNVFQPGPQPVTAPAPVSAPMATAPVADSALPSSVIDEDPYDDDFMNMAILDPLAGDNFDAFNISGYGSDSLHGMFWE